MDPYRLPQHVVPTRYDLRLEPDLVALTFDGDETVALTVTAATSEIVVNAVDLEIREASVSNDAGVTVRAGATLERDTERARLALERAITPGAWRLRVRFTGTLNDKLRGFYRSTYKDATGVSRTIAATQFEATDARRALPCWDEPAFKAVFAVTLAIDPKLTAVSNTAVKSERLEGRRKVLVFGDTIKMSTYLLAFIVGELESSDPKPVGRTPVRVWSVPGKRRLTSFGREIAAVSLGFFEDYYGVPYPGDKLDLLAIPDFAAGAMENLGAITYRETALLVDESQATHAELERVADVVAHENAHMWFGDLVTMTWWNGIWLNEAFATFMEMLAVDAWKPEWRRWTTFGVSRAAAFVVDGLHSTRPIEFPVRAPRDADAMFDVLTYEKGASVLRMLEQHLGADVFRAGVRDYLRAHAYANADTGDLWAALGRAAQAPIPEVMDGWIFNPGYPLVSVRLDGSELVLSQQRFTYLPSPPEGLTSTAATTAPPQLWRVPVQLKVTAGGRSATRRMLLQNDDLRIPAPAGFESVVVNEGGHGFYRVRYSAPLLDRLVGTLPDGLAAIERFNLINDTWAAAMAGLVPLTDFLELTGRFKREPDRNVWAIILAALSAINRLVDSAANRPGLEALVRDRIAPMVEVLGWSPRAGDDELTRQLRGDLLRALGTLGNDAGTQRKALELYLAHERDRAVSKGGEPSQGSPGPSVDANVLPALIATLAHTGDGKRYDEFLARFRTAATPQDEQRYLYALAAFQQPALIEQTLARTVNGEVRTQDAPFVVRSMLMGVASREIAWSFVKREWDTMDRFYPKHGLRRMCEGVIGLATRALEEDVHRFFETRKIDLGGKTRDQYFEQLRIAVALRERESSALAQYLARFA